MRFFPTKRDFWEITVPNLGPLVFFTIVLYLVVRYGM